MTSACVAPCSWTPNIGLACTPIVHDTRVESGIAMYGVGVENTV